MINNTDFNSPVSELIKKRYSCRTYKDLPLSPADLTLLENFTKRCQEGRFGNPIRFQIAAASEEDVHSLKDLGTYGFIKNPAGFVVGSVVNQPFALEDFGYQMELIILRAVELGIGSCWLGGTFTKSRFSRLMDLNKGENIPSVISIGYPADQKAWMDRISRIYAGADRRLPWNEIFFSDTFTQPLSHAQAEEFQKPLELVRLAPSASNRQPWRILKRGDLLHFFLKRTKNYPSPLFKSLLGLADLQRIDMGIVMAHFEISAQEMGLVGDWIMDEPDLPFETSGMDFIATWQGDN